MTLRADGLVKQYDGVRALAGATVEFAASGITGIIGPNGAGKTTLVDALTGFLQVDSGRCSLGSVDTTTMRPEQIARLGVARTFQEVRLVWRESVLENVMLAIRTSGEHFFRALTGFKLRAEHERVRAKALDALRVVDLEGDSKAPVRSLSYGQQKLLSLARALATDARWLILDEPVSGVSPPLISSVLETVRRLAREGRVVVFIEHDIRAVREVADTVVVLNEGRVVATGPTEDVLSRDDVLEAYVD